MSDKKAFFIPGDRYSVWELKGLALNSKGQLRVSEGNKGTELGSVEPSHQLLYLGRKEPGFEGESCVQLPDGRKAIIHRNHVDPNTPYNQKKKTAQPRTRKEPTKQETYPGQTKPLSVMLEGRFDLLGEKTVRAVKTAALRVKKRSPKELADIEQDCWEAVVECQPRHDPQKGASFVWYAHCAAYRLAAKRNWKEMKHREHFVTVNPTELPPPAVDSGAPMASSPEQIVISDSLRAVILRVLGPQDADLLPLLLGIQPADEIAKVRGVDRQVVYLASHRARTRLRLSPELQGIWEDL